MLFGSLSVDWYFRLFRKTGIPLLFGFPDELLKQISFILDQKELLCMKDDAAKILDNSSTFGGKFRRR
jgi:hypothetical protein